MTCPYCKTPNVASSRNCWSCGRELPEADQDCAASVASRNNSGHEFRSHPHGQWNVRLGPSMCPMCKEPIRPGASTCPHCRSKILSKEEVSDRIAECKKKIRTNQSFGCLTFCLFAIITIWAVFMEGMLYAVLLPFVSTLVSLPNIIEIKKRLKESEELKEYAKTAGFAIQ